MKIKVSCVQMTSSKYSEKNYKKILKILENKKIKFKFSLFSRVYDDFFRRNKFTK